MMITEQRWDDSRQKRRKVRNKHTENKVSSARTCHGEKRCGDKRREKRKRKEEIVERRAEDKEQRTKCRIE